MNNRELFNAIMHYEDFDRMPVIHWSVWPETLARWKNEGLPEDIEESYGAAVNEFLHARPTGTDVAVELGLFPRFEEETIEETAESRTLRQDDGVIARHWKNKSCIPHYVDFTMKGPDWERGWAEYKKRLQPDAGRVPDDLNEKIEQAANADVPVTTRTGSLIGWIRDWIGVEGLAYLAYDNRDLLKEMVD